MSTAPLAATTFQLAPIDLGGGVSLTGSIRTNGTIGLLTSADISSWNLQVTTISDIVYNPANTVNISSMVTSNGNQLLVPTSFDGTSDGGSLAFRGGRRLQVQVADFTGANTHGGQAFYVAGGAFNFLPLNRPNNAQYVAANVSAPGSNVFDLVRKRFSSGEIMSGTITTDGTGPATKITGWDILIRDIQRIIFNQNNSRVFNISGVSATRTKLTVTPFDVDGNAGNFSFGNFVAGDFNGVLLGDFTFDPGGQAGYVSPTTFQTVSPLPLDSEGNFVVGVAAVPEPLGWTAMLFGLFGVWALRRSK